MNPEKLDFNNGPQSPESSAKPIENYEDIMAKVIDIYEAHDLKFKDTFGINNLSSFLKSGILGEIVQEAIPQEVLSEKNRKSLFSYRDRLNKARDVRDGYMEGSDIKFESGERPGKRGGVFYPEGIVNIIKTLSIASEPISNSEVWKKVESYQANRLKKEGPMGSTYQSSLHWLADTLGRKKLPPELKLLLKGIGLEVETYSQFIESKKDTITISDIEKVWSDIRLLILKDILSDGLTEDYTRKDSFQPHHYRMNLGLIFSDKVKVLSSPDMDFPTEAVVMGFRASPRDMVGIFINFGKETYKFLKTKTLKYVPSVGKELEVKDRIFGEKILKAKIKDLEESENIDSEELQKIGDLTVYEYLVQQAEKHHLPLYNLNGDLLWPKKIGHEEM